MRAVPQDLLFYILDPWLHTPCSKVYFFAVQASGLDAAYTVCLTTGSLAAPSSSDSTVTVWVFVSAMLLVIAVFLGLFVIQVRRFRRGRYVRSRADGERADNDGEGREAGGQRREEGEDGGGEVHTLYTERYCLADLRLVGPWPLCLWLRMD